MQTQNPWALKEWAVLCSALSAGCPQLLLRKGGIAEGPAGFGIEHPEFWLLPTRFHQAAEELAPGGVSWLEEAAASAPPAGQLRLDLYAVVESVIRFEHELDLERVHGFHLLAEDTLRSRFHYRRPGLMGLLLRVYRRPSPWMVPDRPEYAGCHSWVDLRRPLETDGLTPLQSDEEFAEYKSRLQQALGDVPLKGP